jgi:uncharacterized membrane protein YsdA (DUF1294 family)
VLKVLAGYLVLVNLAAYLVYWWDKRRAEKGKRRISEKELLLWALAGGTLGALLAMRRFRHKTKKLSFRLAFAAVVLLQLGAAWLATARPWER